jgi:hypothetical protein
MTTNEEDEFMEQMMAKHNTSMTAAREATQVLEGVSHGMQGYVGCKGNLTTLRRILHLDLAKENPK